MVREGLIQRQARRVLENDRHALILATVFSAVPFMGWLALAMVALLTLRKGWQAGGKLLLPVLLTHVLAACVSMPWSTAVFTVCINVLPCYLAAGVLQQTSSWRLVSAVLLLLVMVSSVLIQSLSPDFIVMQYEHLELAIRSMSSNQASVLDFWGARGVSPAVLANYLLGVQAASIAFSAMMPVLFARSIQAQLFYPGGFREEMLYFRGDRTGFFILVLLLVAAYYEWTLAINGLPLVLFYFILAGLSLAAYVFSNMRPLALLVLLVVPMMLLAWVVLPLYMVLGAFDSLFNFRLYLSSKAGKAT